MERASMREILVPPARRSVRGGHIVALVLAGACVASGREAFGSAVSPSLERAVTLRERASRALVKDRAEGVDLFYESAVEAYGVLVLRGADVESAAGREAVCLYNDSLSRCLQAASAFGRIDARSRLEIVRDGHRTVVPIVQRGFVWSPWEFSMLVDPANIEPMPEIKTRHARPGLGAVEVVQRVDLNRTTPFLARLHPFAATAVLRPDLGAWFGEAPPDGAGDQLELIDPRRVDTVPLGSRVVSLAADFDAPMSQFWKTTRGSRLGSLAFLRPGEFAQSEGLYVFEPYQPGKIPVVLVHGLRGTPLIFAQMINDLRSDPVLEERYQFWAFSYATGNNFLRSARLLRRDLDRARATFDPGGTDPALGQMVLVGYSMGGLVSKAQVTWSGQAVWETVFSRPLESLCLEPETRLLLAETLFFEPRPSIGRVIYLATPHRGANMANAVIGRLADRLVRLPDDTREAYRRVYGDNPGAFRPGFARPVSSIDLLQNDHPLLMTLDQLPRLPTVTFHNIVGLQQKHDLKPPGDGIVPLTSSLIGGVASELFIDEGHVEMPTNPAAIAEIRSILLEP
jgi:pimeloyl-ACP methyl ester carboxylesterase